MTVDRRALLRVVAAVSLLGACAAGDVGTGRVDGVVSESAPQKDVAAATAADNTAFLASVRRTSDASGYQFAATVTLAAPEGDVVVKLDGARDGRNRTLTVTTAVGAVAYVLQDGAATMDRGDGPQSITLTEVPAAPSLGSLLEMQNIRLVGDGVAEGTLDAQDVLGDTATGGDVQAIVTYEPDGYITRLEIRASDGSLAAVVDYDQVIA